MPGSAESVFDELLASHRTELYAFSFSICRNYHDAEAILQQTSLIAWQKFAQFQTGTSFGKWARAILYRAAMNHVRAQKRLPILCDEETLEALSDAYERVDEAMKRDRLFEVLEHCLGRLSPSHYQALRLRYYEDRDTAYLARVLQRSAEAVDVMMFRIRQQIGKCIRAALAEDEGAA